jgi:hypothetical protein
MKEVAIYFTKKGSHERFEVGYVDIPQRVNGRVKRKLHGEMYGDKQAQQLEQRKRLKAYLLVLSSSFQRALSFGANRASSSGGRVS